MSVECFPCKYPAKYEADSIRWLMQEKKLCEAHIEKAKVMFAALESQKKAPEKKLQVKKTWHDKDREPGQDG